MHQINIMDRNLTRFERNIFDISQIEARVVQGLIQRPVWAVITCMWVNNVLALCDPGSTRKQPFSGVESSKAIHTVTLASGLIGQYSPS